MQLKYAIPATFLVLACAAVAQPSGGFYLLKSKESGKVLCSQLAISPDWVRQSGPFKDQRCTVPEELKQQKSGLPANPLDLGKK